MGLPDIENIPDTGAVFTLGKSRFADNVASHFFIRKDPVISITCGDEHSAVVCQSGRLFVFGSNNWGQLGLGHKNHVSKPSCVKSLKPEKVTHVACGRAHTLICTDNQKIFACGSDQESQLGRANLTLGDSSSSPVMIYDCGLAGPRILQVAAGTQHSLALTSDGGVLAWGSNLEGQLGLPGTSGLMNKPTQVHIPEPVKQISAGYYHSAFLTESGLVYVCGETESGKLGIALDFMTQVAPKQMQLSVPAVHVACGGHHTLVLGEDGNIYGTGSNANGQLGMGVSVTEIQTPKQLSSDALQGEKINKVVCGESHIAIVTESGKLFTCGDGRYGKLGLEENENNVHEFTYAIKYQELFVTNAACGGCHTILVGRRREFQNSDEESTQMKMSALPPLKVPLSRIQNDNPKAENSDNNENELEAEEKNENEISEKSMDKQGEIAVDTIKNVEKPESPKKSSDYEDSMPIESTKLEEDSMMNEKIDSSENMNGESGSETINLVEEQKEFNTIERPESSKSMANKIVEEEKSNNETNNGESIMNETADDERSNKGSSNGESIDNHDSENMQVNEETSNDEPMTVEKPECPPLPVPPPKPPRQKTGSAGSSSSSHRESISSSKNEKIVDMKPEEESSNSDPPEEQNQDDEKKSVTESEKGSEKSSEKKSMSSGKSRSSKSKTDTDDTLPIEATVEDCINQMENVADKTVDKVEEKIDMIADDADVVASPITRTGKMGKLFKSRKTEVENGTSSLPNPKAKSKTCSIL